MDLRHELDTLHREHAEILEFLIFWEDTLSQIASQEYEIRWRALKQLQAMAGKIVGICEHCRREEESPDSPFRLFADEAEKSRLADDHFHLHRANFEFRREMEFTTASHSEELCAQGENLLSGLRQHITYEEELLKRIGAGRLHLSSA